MNFIHLLLKASHKVRLSILDILHCNPFPIPFWTKYYLLKKFSLWNYQIECFRELYNHSTLQNKTVLEIGGCNLPPEILFTQFQAKQWICVDYFDWWNGHPDGVSQDANISLLNEAAPCELDKKYHIFNGPAEEIPENFKEKFDVVVSICALEHIIRLPEVIEKVYQALRPGGIFYASFAPIWSGPGGSHFWISPSFNYNYSLQHGIPLFAHLLYSPDELREILPKQMSSEIVDRLIHEIYYSEKINRLSYQDYVEILQKSSFHDFTFFPQTASIPAKEKIKLKEKFPNKENFEYSGSVIIAKR